MNFKELYKEYKSKPVLTFEDKVLEIIIDREDLLKLLKRGLKLENILDKIKEILKDPDRDEFDEDGYDDSYYDMIYTNRIKELLEEIE